MDMRILVSRESNEVQLARFARREQGSVRPIRIKDSMRVIEPADPVMFHAIEAIDLEPPG